MRIHTFISVKLFTILLFTYVYQLWSKTPTVRFYMTVEKESITLSGTFYAFNTVPTSRFIKLVLVCYSLMRSRGRYRTQKVGRVTDQWRPPDEERR